MAGDASRRAFGSMRKLPSGRIQVRYFAADGVRHRAPMTFPSLAAAKRWLSLLEADIARGTWKDPLLVGEPLGRYAARWILERPGLSERSVRLYQSLVRLHIEPSLGHLGLQRLSPADLRSWRKELLDAGVGESTVSKSYRLLRAVLNTAADDELIRRNPCRIKGAGIETPAERPFASLQEVMRLASAIDPRYRALVLLAVFGSLRWGELMGLRRADIDLDGGLVTVRRAVSEIGARQVVKEPKTSAGLRSVALPMWLMPELRNHLSSYAEPGEDGRVFVGPKGATPLRPNFIRIWTRALRDSGLSGLHIHDLRHTGNHFAAISGASTRELMGRMGHVSMDAALVYQHRTAIRDRAIADAMDAMLDTLDGSGSGSVENDEGHAVGTATG